MNIVARKTLETFWEKHPETRSSLLAWHTIAKKAEWRSPQEIKDSWPKASIIANNRVVFDVCGGKFRLVVAFKYELGFGWVKFLGTHSEYDNIDARTVAL